MKHILNFSILLVFLVISSCEKADVTSEINSEANSKIQLSNSKNFNVNFQYKTTIQVGGETASEISAYDGKTQKLFVSNVESKQISVFDLSDLNNPKEEQSIQLGSGSPNSVAVYKGMLAVAVEAEIKQNPGMIMVFDTDSKLMISSYQVGALPDMVTFSPNGRYIVSANEGEPNDEYTVDPEGSISVIDLEMGTVSTLNFDAFSSQQSELEAKGFRIFGPGASMSMDIEPEYVTISDNSNYAWVTLQENNGIAKVNLENKVIEAIYPLGFKDYNLPGNEIDPSDKDDIKALNNWPVYGVYMPDAITYIKINGIEYVITANEGDSRDYSGFGEEERIKDIVLDPTAFPDAANLQKSGNLGRLKITSTLGDTDGDGDYDELYSFGGRSFSVWTGNGQMVYDSGSDIATQTLALTPDRFNDNDDRSDDKGAEPETVEVLKVQGNNYILFVALERNDQIMVYDISDPTHPEFLDILSHSGDEAPEGILAVPAVDSPNKRDLLIVSNEDSGTVSIYENIQ